MSSPTRRAQDPWSSIPTELAGVVLRRLPCHADRVRFAAVCKHWRASARQTSPPPHYPWLALPDRTFYSLPGSAFRRLPLHLDRHRALCRPGASSWWSGTPDELRDLQDIVSCEGKLYALDKFNGLFSVSVGTDRRTGNPTVSRVERLMGSPRGVLKHSSRYLLESSGTLLLVCREDAMLEGFSGGSMGGLELELEFEVLKADVERSRWTSVRSVGDDRVLFVGPWCSRAVHATGEHDPIYTAGNRIFFTVDASAKRYNHGYYGYGTQQEPFYCIVYDMSTQRSELFLETRVRPLKGFPVTWLFPPSQG